MNVFGDTELEIGNPQSREEDEFAEEQRRRQEELSDLLMNGFNAFRYNDTTVNSSTTSLEELARNPEARPSDLQLEQNYKDSNLQDQLKILYEVRVREIEKLKEEYEQFKEEKAKEINVLKNKALLAEAEVRHLQITLKNSESLLVEKTEKITELVDVQSLKDQELGKLTKTIDEMKLEISTYQTMLTEFQLKQAENNPLTANSRKSYSEELQKTHHDQVKKLEALFQEEAKRSGVLEKQNICLENDIKKLIASKSQFDDENNLTIMALSKKLQSCQDQIRDLYVLEEALKKENEYFKERLESIDNSKIDLSNGFSVANLDKDTLAVHLEKLRKMLLDKEVEMNVLRAKLKFYDEDLNELFEYRRILSEVYTNEMKMCSKPEHEEKLIFMQRQLRNIEEILDDRNNQIVSLTKDKKALQEQIQLGLQQTRTKLEHLSQKYSLPQLETMSTELNNAEEKINELEMEVRLKEDVINDVKSQLKELTETNNNLIMSLEECKHEEVKIKKENEKLKCNLEELYSKLGVNESDIRGDNDIHDLGVIKSKYEQVQGHLNQIVVYLERMNKKKVNYNAVIKLRDLMSRKETDEGVDLEKMLEDLMLDGDETKDGEQFQKELQDAYQQIQLLNKNNEELLATIGENKQKIGKCNEEIESMGKEYQKLDKIKAQLEADLNSAKHWSKPSDSPRVDPVIFEKCLQAELIKQEVLLRDQLQAESIEKLKKIEEQYTQLYSNERKNSKQQELDYRNQFAKMLEECGRNVAGLEAENLKLIHQFEVLLQEYKTYKLDSEQNVTKYQRLVLEAKTQTDVMGQRWRSIFEYYMKAVASIESQRSNCVNSITNKIREFESQIEFIEKVFKDKEEKYKSSMYFQRLK